MCSARVAGFDLESDCIDPDNMETNCIEQLAKVIAILSQGWSPIDILSDEDTTEIAETYSGMRIRTVENLKTMTRTVTNVTFATLNLEGLRLSMALYEMEEPSPTR